MVLAVHKCDSAPPASRFHQDSADFSRANNLIMSVNSIRSAFGVSALSLASPGNLAALSLRCYHKNVVDHYDNPRNVGSFDKADPNVGTGLVGECLELLSCWYLGPVGVECIPDTSGWSSPGFFRILPFLGIT